MAKSKAQRMKEYRQRKKEKLGEEWLKAERLRVKAYYVPTECLSKEKQTMRRAKNKESCKRYRHKKQLEKERIRSNEAVASTSGEPDMVSSSSTAEACNEVSSSTSPCELTVKMPFVTSTNKAKGKKRVSRALARSYRTIETLEDKNEELKKKLKSAQKRIQKVEQKNRLLCNTPRSKADRIISSSGINPKEVPEIRKRLIYSECLNEEIKQAKQSNSQRFSAVQRVVSGMIMKKYRLKSTLQNLTNLNRRKTVHRKEILQKTKFESWRKSISAEVCDFLKRDDNSRILPGQADAVKDGKGKVQKRVLNDFMYNLYLKFRAESASSVSLATFHRLRPKHISLVNFASRSVCLCSKHQNFSFLLRAVKNLKVTMCTSPDSFVKMAKNSQNHIDTILSQIPESQNTVKYQQWRRVKLSNGKERQRIVDEEKLREEFIKMFKKAYAEFECHVDRVADQYRAVRDMKNKLPSNQVLVQMDFSENYTCQSLEEIQSAYWNSSMVNLHPVVIYFRNDELEISHRSYVYVSEVLSHNALMVIAILKKVVHSAKLLVPDLHTIHMWTDSPSSQYRNKSIFDVVSHFQNRFGVNASWHYFECGHGKGPCDGVGGTAKRNADNAVKQGKAVIQDAADFFAWACQSQGGISYEMVTLDDYNESKNMVEARNNVIKPLPGTMKVHAVVGLGDGRILIRDTSCACESCFINAEFNENSECIWKKTRIMRKAMERGQSENLEVETDTAPENQLNEKDTKNEQETESLAVKDNNTSNNEKIEQGDFVVVRYEGRAYVAKVTEVDEDDSSVYVNFMAACGQVEGRLKWPRQREECWVEKEDILSIIEAPQPTGKTGRIFSVPDDVAQLLN